jgi:hypothetical protein
MKSVKGSPKSVIGHKTGSRSQSRAAVIAATRLRLSDLSRRVLEDQRYYRMFGIGLYPCGKFSLSPSIKPQPVSRYLEQWLRLCTSLKTSSNRRHYSAWLIQSLWRAYKTRQDGEKPARMRDFWTLDVGDLQRAELNGLNSAADELLRNNLMSVLGCVETDE